MTADEFYRQDVELARAYRKADEMRKSRRNEELWLQGAYIYEAICAVAPVLRAFSKATKPNPYPKEPYDIFGGKKAVENEPKIQTETQKKANLFSAWAIDFNIRKSEGGSHDADGRGSGSDINIGRVELDEGERPTGFGSEVADEPRQSCEIGQSLEDREGSSES